MMNFIKLIIFILATVNINSVLAFEMLIDTGYKNEPDFTKYGFKRSRIIYEQEIYNHRENRDTFNERHINKISSIIESGKFKIVILDIEHWTKDWNKKSLIERSQVIRRYKEALVVLKENFPDTKFGYYRVVPTWAHWNINYSNEIFKRWERENYSREEIWESVDTIYPSLYTYNDDPEKWKTRATLAIEKAKQLGRGKKIIPFIWPGYHPSSPAKLKGVKRLPRKYWRIQLEHIKAEADGFVIWDGALGNMATWNDDMPWWKETLKFIDGNFIK